jgi:hypothetical protein
VGLCLSEDIEGQKSLVVMLSNCFDALKSYGKEPEQLEGIVRLFKVVLGRYTWESIESAFLSHLSSSEDMPTPANIVAFIDSDKSDKKWCSVTFLDIKRRIREGEYVTLEEKRYCEEFISSKVNDDESMYGAIKSSEVLDRKYWIDG